MHHRRRSSLLLAAAAAGVLAACSPTPQQAQPTGTDDGIQLTGRIDDKRLAVSEGAPQVLRGDCDPNDGRDSDLCVLMSTIDGERLTIVFENPEALEVGAIEVVDEACRGTTCDGVRDGLVVDVRLGTDTTRALSGRVVLDEAGLRRYRGELALDLVPNGRLTGSFNLDTFGAG